MIHLIKGKKVNPYHSKPYVSEFDIIEVEKIGLLEKNSIKLSLTREREIHTGKKEPINFHDAEAIIINHGGKS
jgi:hypothetical protein